MRCSTCCYSTQRKDTFARHLNSVSHSKKTLQKTHHNVDFQNNLKEIVAIAAEQAEINIGTVPQDNVSTSTKHQPSQANEIVLFVCDHIELFHVALGHDRPRGNAVDANAL